MFDYPLGVTPVQNGMGLIGKDAADSLALQQAADILRAALRLAP
ncbi:MAG: hypothetical protein AB1651_13775 [Pseudomonadota bacterium]|jgi:hypothetical protein